MQGISNVPKFDQRAYVYILLSLALLASPIFADEGDPALNPGYVMCKDAPLQLRWFTRFGSSTEFMDAGATTNEPLSAANNQARKALANGWCASTDGMELFSINRIEPCDDVWDQIPNGGCAKVTVSPRASSYQSTWYTFKNAISQ